MAKPNANISPLVIRQRAYLSIKTKSTTTIILC